MLKENKKSFFVFAMGFLLIAFGVLVGSSLWNYYHRPMFCNKFFMHEGTFTYQWYSDLWTDNKGNLVQLDNQLRVIVVISLPHQTSFVGPHLPLAKDDHAEIKILEGRVIEIPRISNRYYIVDSKGKKREGEINAKQFEQLKKLLNDIPPDDYAKSIELIISSN